MRFPTLALVASSLVLAGPAAAYAKSDDKEQEDPDQKIRCKRVAVTGSLVRREKICKTVAEWREISENGNRTSRAIVESGQSCSGGPICSGN